MKVEEKPTISACGKFHVGGDLKPLYEAQFDEVLAFHEVNGCWIASAQKGSDAFHINIDGKPIYTQRFKRCFGFYHGLSAVIDEDGWYHIDQAGNALYPERYGFAGNYQENAVVVMNADGQYFHLNAYGAPLYNNRWQYCGDFRDGIAVVQAMNGLSTHIRYDSTLLHQQWFLDLDVFHKRYARAKTSRGWCHIDKYGVPIYSQRYLSVEPFYNGFSRCETNDGALLVIDERGYTVRLLRSQTTDKFVELSADMVGYWKTYVIYSAVKLGVFDNLPAAGEQLSIRCACDPQKLERLMKGLVELDLVELTAGCYTVSEKGSYLCSSNSTTLADAAIEYGEDLLQCWQNLPGKIQDEKFESKIFSEVASDPNRVISHHRMLGSYALHDYSAIIPFLPINKEQRILDAAGGTGTLATLLQAHFPVSSICLGDMASVVAESTFPVKLEMDLFSTWPRAFDIVVLARVIHDWEDADAVKILQNAKQALTSSGVVYLLEMVLEENSTQGALCDLHLLAATGGKERTVTEFDAIAIQSGLKVCQVILGPSLVSLIILRQWHNNE
ncbi:methyltransferase [Cobetia sp. Ld8]|uniref:methyltransferase n=1 Tax=Cobetia sp. Ld8 TaxID=649154 RepID=UPI003867480B